MSRSYSSRAHTDTVCAFVLVPVQDLRALLPAGLTTAALPFVAPDLHPVWLDLGHIRDGAAEAAGVQQDRFWEDSAAAVWGALGLWTGGVAGWLGGPLGAAAGAKAGAAAGRSMGGRYGRALSQASSRALGTYDEAIVAVPGVVPAARAGAKAGRRYNFVLGMYANSRIAIWGDQTLRYGYGKRLTKITRRGLDDYRIQGRPGQELLRAKFAPAGEWHPGGGPSPEACPWFQEPLLGALGPDAFAVSWLERPSSQTARHAPVSGQLVLAAELLGGLPGGERALEPAGPTRPWGCFALRDQPTRVSYPERRRLNDL